MTNRKIIPFFVICFVWAWVLWLPFVLPSTGLYEMTETLSGLIMLAVMLGAFGPLIAAVILVYRSGGKQELKKYFKRCFNMKINAKYYLLAVILSLGITALVHYTVNLSGIDQLPNNLVPSEIETPLYILVIPYTLMLFFLGGGQEEFGWRGYVQDPLQDKYGVIKGSVIIGLMWSIWHLPLWFIQGEGHAYYSFFAFALYTTSWSVIIGIMYNLAGKKMMIPWIMHTLGNLSVPLFPILFLQDVPQPGYWIWAIANSTVAIIFSYWFDKRKRIQV